MAGQPGQPEYVGFWMRFLAFIIDSLAIALPIMLIVVPLFGADRLMPMDPELTVMTGADLFQTVVSAVVVLAFWLLISTTPGKLVLGAYIVDANTLRRPATWQLVVRYLGYYLNFVTLMLGFAWIGIDRRKQGLHDKLAQTVVIRGKPVDEPESQ